MGDVAARVDWAASWADIDELVAETSAQQRLDWVLQTRESSELRLQTEQMGRSLLEWLRHHTTASAAPAVADSSFPVWSSPSALSQILAKAFNDLTLQTLKF